MTYNTYQQEPTVASASSPAGRGRLNDETISFATDLFSALAHPTRLRIVELLTISERTVNEIAHELDILQPNTSQHLAILQRAGVVRVTPRGALRSYSIRAPRMDQILQLADELRANQGVEDAPQPRDGHSSGNSDGHRLIVRDGNGVGRIASVAAARLMHSQRDGNGADHGSGNGKLRP